LNSFALNISVAGLSVIIFAQVVVSFQYIPQLVPNAIIFPVLVLSITLIFSAIVVALSFTNALFSEIHFALSLVFIFLEL